MIPFKRIITVTGAAKAITIPAAPSIRARANGRATPRPPRPARASGGPRMRRFTFGHGSRQFRIGPVAFWTVVGTLVIMAGWSVVTATYFAFQDDVLARMIARQAEMQFAYEDRIADMRAQVDRVTSRQLLDQEQLEQKLDQIVRRQSLLEQRATTMGTVADPAATGSLRPPRAAGQPARARRSRRRSPGPPCSARPPPATCGPRTADLRPADSPWPGSRRRRRAAMSNPVLARLQESLDRVEGRQVNTLASLEESYEFQGAADARRARRCRSRRAPSTPTRRPAARSSPTACRPMPARSKSRSIASTWRAPRPSA